MKKIKSLISLLLVFGMLLTLWAAPVQASDRITVNCGTDNIVKVTPPGPGNFSSYGGLVIFGTGHLFEYNINAPKAGTYHISFDVEIKPDTVMNVTCGDANFDVKNTDGRKEIYGTKVDLKEGDNTIAVKCTGGTHVWLYNIYAEPASDKIETDFSRKEGAFANYFIPTIIEAEDFDMGPNGSYSTHDPVDTAYRGLANIAIAKNANGNNVINLRNSDWAKYSFSSPQTGSFKLALMTNVKTILNLYFDDCKNPIIVNTQAGSETQVANVYLEEGAHQLRVECADKLVELDYLAFTYASEKGLKPEDLATVPPTQEEIEAMKNEFRPVWKEIWVDALAKGNGNGNKSNPFKTIEEAKEEVKKIRDNMQGDIVVKLMPGEYSLKEKLSFNEADGGINGYRVIYQGANTIEKPVISGGTYIKNWEPHENGVWKASVPDIKDTRTLYINGYAAQRARSKYIYNFGTAYDDPETPETLDGYTVGKINFPKITNPSEAEAVFNQLWCLQRVPMKDIIDDGSNWIIVCDQPHLGNMLSNHNKDVTPLPGSKGYIENAYELIDEPGEFYFDKFKGMMYYYPFPEEDLRTAEVVAGTTEFMFEIMGSSKDSRIEGLSFDNLDFRHATWLDVNRTGLIALQADCIIDENQPATDLHANGRTMPAVMQIRRARDINFTNCNFQNLGTSAIFMDEHVEDSKVVGNVFHDLSGTAVSVGSWRSRGLAPDDLCEDIEVSNNVIHRIGLDYAGSVAIGFYYARNIKVEHNDIKDIPYTGITGGWGWGSKTPINLDCSGHSIRYNRIDDNSNVVKDGGPIYTLGDMRNTYIEYNYVSDNRDAGGVYFDQGSAMMVCRYNVMENMQQQVINGAGGQSYGLILKDNWSDKPQPAEYKFYAVDSELELPHVYEDGNWPSEAKQVMANAGLERGYKKLLAGLEYPQWRKAFYEYESVVNEFYRSVNIIEKHCTDWIPGGEGVGYHETREGQEPRVYDLGLNVSVGDTTSGEWMAYEVDMAKSGDYDLEIVYSFLATSGEANVSSTAGVNVYVDGELVVDNVNLPNTGSWNAYVPCIAGDPISLTEGKHIIKIEFVNAWAFEKFRLINTKLTETEPEFDDGVMLR